jgi:hypothetical protein
VTEQLLASEEELGSIELVAHFFDYCLKTGSFLGSVVTDTFYVWIHV